MTLHADHSALQVAAHLMIAFLFIYRCISAIGRPEEHVKRIASRGVPLARPVLYCGLATMLIGGVSVALDIYAAIGAAMLIVFTMSANHLYHDFWNMQGGERNRHLYTACNNVAVMGGLLLVVAG